MRKGKTHIRVQHRPDGVIFSLCGKRDPDNHTTSHYLVDCKACKNAELARDKERESRRDQKESQFIEAGA